MVDIIEVAENIYRIDDEVYGIKGWGAVYLIKEEGKALMDTGPTTSAPVVLAGMAKVGVQPEDINYVVATHIHLDHSGGMGFLLQKMPQAKVVVHQRGAKHLIDPSRLVDSMVAVQGEETKRMFGDVVPVAESRIRVVREGDRIDLGCEQVLHIIDAPGHAPHELCVVDSRNNGIFTGDAGGMFLGEGISSPLTPPPNFDADVYLKTQEKMTELEPSRLYVAHFGAVMKVKEHFEAVIDEMKLMDELAGKLSKTNELNKLGEKLLARKSARLAALKKMPSLYQYVIENVIPMNVSGFVKYYKEKHNLN
jgi:glyoxylase-like metal-dependent hydrolase (beta-lactamase superfamily II)